MAGGFPPSDLHKHVILSPSFFATRLEQFVVTFGFAKIQFRYTFRAQPKEIGGVFLHFIAIISEWDDNTFIVKISIGGDASASTVT